jgi:hypothetical protein
MHQSGMNVHYIEFGYGIFIHYAVFCSHLYRSIVPESCSQQKG